VAAATVAMALSFSSFLVQKLRRNRVERRKPSLFNRVAAVTDFSTAFSSLFLILSLLHYHQYLWELQ